MEVIRFNNDIQILYVTASSFPEGIQNAHERLHASVPFSYERKYFGISRPERGKIIYHAAAEVLNQKEIEDWAGETLTLPKGKYVSLLVNDYLKDIESIGKAFETLLLQPGIDPEGYCVEWYFNDKDVRCMIRLKDQHNGN